MLWYSGNNMKGDQNCKKQALTKNKKVKTTVIMKLWSFYISHILNIYLF